MSNQSNDKVFSTRDLCLASTLVTLKFYMTGVDYQIEGMKSQPVGYFKFENSEELQEARKKFLQGMISVEPREFLRNLHTLKAEVQNITMNPHNGMYAEKKEDISQED